MRAALLALVLLMAAPAQAETSAEAQARRPALFDPVTGYRIERQRAPTPSDIPGAAKRIDVETARGLKDAILIDVFATRLGRYDEFDGTWMGERARETIPGAVWLPEVGRGILTDAIDEYFRDNLARLAAGDPCRPVVLFCIADCWMSWNAAQRVASYGYTNVHWLREGTDGWLDAGYDLEPVEPVPVTVE